MTSTNDYTERKTETGTLCGVPQYDYYNLVGDKEWIKWTGHDYVYVYDKPTGTLECVLDGIPQYDYFAFHGDDVLIRQKGKEDIYVYRRDGTIRRRLEMEEE